MITGPTIAQTALAAFLVRVAFIFYGEWQDSISDVKYTDVDYYVFHDAAQFAASAQSPYQRHTYRYTPLLAWLLLPNHYLHFSFGKFLFAAADTLAGAMLCGLLSSSSAAPSTGKGAVDDVRLVSLLWWFNPITVAVSTRGNAEALLCCCLLCTVAWIKQGKVALPAAMLGVCIHLKLFPVIYTLPLMLYAARPTLPQHDAQAGWKQRLTGTFQRLLSPRSLLFALITVATFAALGMWMYTIYGWDFVHESLLYHVTRKDHRHNFSPYFYLLYVAEATPWAHFASLAAFLPQLALVALVGLLFYDRIGLCVFLQTFIFVTFNKVCTSQYFLWYLCFLPLAVRQSRVAPRRGAALAAVWFGGQGVWLLSAYLLEFKGWNTFVFVWLSGLAFFAANVFVIREFIVRASG